jgi:DNA polymerase-3 subunit epsilon
MIFGLLGLIGWAIHHATISITSAVERYTTPVAGKPRRKKSTSALKIFDVISRRTDWVVIDLETTGFGKSAEVIEIAIVDSEGRLLANTGVRPKGRITKEITKITGLDRKNLKHSPTWPEIDSSIRKILESRPVITYNAAFDLRILNQTAQRFNLQPFEIESYCMMLGYAAHAAVPHPTRENAFRWHKLTGACEREGIEKRPAHRALDDALQTWALIHTVSARRGLGRRRSVRDANREWTETHTRSDRYTTMQSYPVS